jgi:hypothetical protein
MAEYEWSTVSQDDVNETKISFDFIGDEFIGTYLGTRSQQNDNGSYTQLRFRGEDGEVYFTNANYSLSEGMRQVRPNNLVRLTYVADKDTGQPTPMRIFRVDVARPKRPERPAARPAPAQANKE